MNRIFAVSFMVLLTLLTALMAVSAQSYGTNYASTNTSKMATNAAQMNVSSEASVLPSSAKYRQM